MNTNKNMVLRTHHIGYWKGDRSNRVSNLLTVCDKCHTQVNHQPSGKLYGLQPKSKKLPEAAFMNSVRYILVDEIYNLQEKLNVSFKVAILYHLTVLCHTHLLAQHQTNSTSCQNA